MNFFDHLTANTEAQPAKTGAKEPEPVQSKASKNWFALLISGETENTTGIESPSKKVSTAKNDKEPEPAQPLRQKTEFPEDYEILHEVKKRAQPKSEPVKQEDIFEGIVNGGNWFEVRYSTGEIRYTQHSTKENLLEYYDRMNHHYKCRKPQEVKPIRYENGRILTIG